MHTSSNLAAHTEQRKGREMHSQKQRSLMQKGNGSRALEMLLRPTCCAGEASASSGTSVACSDKLRELLPFQHRLTGAALVVVHTRMLQLQKKWKSWVSHKKAAENCTSVTI